MRLCECLRMWVCLCEGYGVYVHVCSIEAGTLPHTRSISCLMTFIEFYINTSTAITEICFNFAAARHKTKMEYLCLHWALYGDDTLKIGLVQHLLQQIQIFEVHRKTTIPSVTSLYCDYIVTKQSPLLTTSSTVI